MGHVNVPAERVNPSPDSPSKVRFAGAMPKVCSRENSLTPTTSAIITLAMKKPLRIRKSLVDLSLMIE
jgi:hypothetical protein